MRLPPVSYAARARAASRDGLPPAWPQAPWTQLVRWSSDIEGFLDELRQQDTPITLDLFGVGRLIVFQTEQALKDVMAGSAEVFGHNNDIASIFVGPKSPLLLNGDAHAHARRRLLPLVSGAALHRHGDEMLRIADQWVSRLRAGERIAALRGTQEMALDVILRTVFGMQPGPDYARMHELSRKFLEVNSGRYNNLVTTLIPPKTLRTLLFGPRPMEPNSWVMKLWPKSGASAAGRELQSVVLRQVQARRATLDDGRDDALAGLLRKGIAQGHPLSDEEALDEAITLLLAGHETTGVTLGWILYRLGQNPHLWGRLREEVEAHFQGDTPDIRGLDKNAYLGAVVQESLRLDGLASGISRRVRRPTTIDGMSVPAGIVVMACTRNSHFSEEKWGDPNRFDPQHQLERKVGALDITAFGGGYRRCTGAAFAEFELKLLLAGVVRRATLRTPAECPVPRVMAGAFPGPANEILMDVVRVEA